MKQALAFLPPACFYLFISLMLPDGHLTHLHSILRGTFVNLRSELKLRFEVKYFMIVDK